MKQLSQNLWAAASICLFSCMPAHCSDYSFYYNLQEVGHQYVGGGDGLGVMGRAERTVQSDRAIFSIKLSVIGNSLDRMIKKINQQLQVLKDFWKKEGVKQSMIHVKNLQIDVQDLKWETTNKGHKYSISYPIQLIIDDIEKAPKIQEKTMEFVEKDFLFSNQNLDYFYTKLVELEQELTLEALKDGHKMAQNLAQSFGLPISIQPTDISSAALHAHPLTENPDPYWMHYTPKYYGLKNVFVVLVPMYYRILSPEKRSPTTSPQLHD